MKYVRFYEENNGAFQPPTVLAIFPENRRPDGAYEAVGAIMNEANSPVAGTSASVAYLRKYGRRISEKRAREIHPALFERLDNLA